MNPQKIRKFYPPYLYKKETVVPPIHWCRRVISANTIVFGGGETRKEICNTSPICQDIAYWLG
jgi:hypothetical protein